MVDVPGEHAGRVLAFHGGRHVPSRREPVARCAASLCGVPIGDDGGDTHINPGSGPWRSRIHGTRIARTSVQLQVGDAFFVLPVAVMVPDRMTSYELVS